MPRWREKHNLNVNFAASGLQEASSSPLRLPSFLITTSFDQLSKEGLLIVYFSLTLPRFFREFQGFDCDCEFRKIYTCNVKEILRIRNIFFYGEELSKIHEMINLTIWKQLTTRRNRLCAFYRGNIVVGGGEQRRSGENGALIAFPAQFTFNQRESPLATLRAICLPLKSLFPPSLSSFHTSSSSSSFLPITRTFRAFVRAVDGIRKSEVDAAASFFQR